MKKDFIALIATILLGWALISWVNVVMVNNNPDANIAFWNLFRLLF